MIELRSVLVGTAGLDVALVVAAILSATRSLAAANAYDRKRVELLFLLCIGLQAIHFAEEFLTGFHVRFPELLGLTPWPPGFFVAFNVAWIVVWVWSAVGLRQGVRLWEWPAWFLAVALVANGVFHPLFALRAGGYFPGLVTSPFVGVAGGTLLVGLVHTTVRTAGEMQSGRRMA